MSEKYKVLARYEIGSNTIRKVPENYCLIAFNEAGAPRFDVDPSTIIYRELVTSAYEKWQATGQPSKIRLAAAISVALKSYRPFLNYPAWESGEVFYALNELKQGNFIEITKELEQPYRELLNASWMRRGTIDKARIHQMLNDHVAKIYATYQEMFPLNEQTDGLEINVFVPISEGSVMSKAEIYVGPHSREEAEAAFLAHTGIPYSVYVKSSYSEDLLTASDTVGSYVESKYMSYSLV